MANRKTIKSKRAPASGGKTETRRAISMDTVDMERIDSIQKIRATQIGYVPGFTTVVREALFAYLTALENGAK